MPGRQPDNERGGIGQGHLLDNARPARVGRPLQMEEKEDSTKEAFNGAAFAQFVFGPGGRQAPAILLALRVPGDDGDSS